MKHLKKSLVVAASVSLLALSAVGGAQAGTSNQRFDTQHAGAGAQQVGNGQTKAITGASGYMSLTHNYPAAANVKFWMRTAGGHEASHTGWLKAGSTAYLHNNISKGTNVYLRAELHWTQGSTLKGTWRSN